MGRARSGPAPTPANSSRSAAERSSARGRLAVLCWSSRSIPKGRPGSSPTTQSWRPLAWPGCRRGLAELQQWRESGSGAVPGSLFPGPDVTSVLRTEVTQEATGNRGHANSGANSSHPNYTRKEGHMRRISTAITAAALALSMTLGLNAGTAQAAPAGYDSAYQFESAFLTLKPGDSGTFSVFFANTGTTSWVKGSGSQVNLAICAADKVTCNVTSAQSAWAVGWLSSTAYATHTKDAVAPGDFSAFTYNIKVPAGQAGGVYRFNGDLVQGSSGTRVHPEGYYQDGNITGAGPSGGVLDVTPGYSVTEDHEVSTAVPGNGQHTYTFTTTLTGTLTFAVITSGNIVRNSDGTFSFCDTDANKRADGVGAGSTFITAVNGVSVSASTVRIKEPIPSNGTITVTIDQAKLNQRVRIVAWQDKNNNGQIDLTGAGDVNCDFPQPYDTTTDGALTVSGRKFYFGPKGQFGAQFPDGAGNPQCEPVFRHDSANQVFSAGPTSATSLAYFYDANDIFQIQGTMVTLATFKSELTASSSGSADTIKINYDPNAAGISTFNICVNKGSNAPTDLSAATGNFDSGTVAEDVRLSFTAPSTNTVSTYNIQRASLGSSVTADATNCNLNTAAPADGSVGVPTGGNFSTVGATTVNAGEQGSFSNFDVSNGGWCYRVSVTNANTGINSYSNYVPVNIPGAADITPPTSSLAVLTSSSGFANTLDTGDKLEITFSEAMSIAANAVIRVTDSDCGPATNAGPADCSGGLTNTVADIICGTNATCTLSTDKTILTVTMTANPTIVAAGAVAGAQFPVVVTDSNGVTDLSGNAWNLTGSGDRLITNP